MSVCILQAAAGTKGHSGLKKKSYAYHTSTGRRYEDTDYYRSPTSTSRYSYGYSGEYEITASLTLPSFNYKPTDRFCLSP